MFKPPKVLISILTYNNTTDTLQTIEAYKRQSYPHFHLQVIDNASPRDVAGRLKKHHPDLEIIRLEKNTGYTGGNNWALKRGLEEGYDHVLITNHDVLVDDNFLERMVETAQTNPSCGVVGAVEVDAASGDIKTIGGRTFSFWKARGRWIKAKPIDQSNHIYPVDYVQGAVILFTRQALEAGVMLDERLFMYCEEIDLGFQLKAKGLSALTDLRCQVRHKSASEKYNRFQGYLIQRNRLYLCRKYAPAGMFVVSALYAALLELPVKTVLRLSQGHGDYAWHCWRGFADAMRGEMGYS